ncbi:hypothetical protein VB693_18150 [Anabaena sp. UHCC 0399]|nr:hypothetical protein [Anabaena sp. UHCC 0399]MEA5567349.1 hypothetical protein [Anabaena sp. UHCC 0399]
MVDPLPKLLSPKKSQPDIESFPYAWGKQRQKLIPVTTTKKHEKYTGY